MDALRPEETLTKNISATSPQIHKALNKTATEGGGSDTVSCSWNHLDKVEMVLLAPPLPWDSASFSIKQWFSGVYPGNTSPGQVAGTEHPHYLAPVTWDQPLCARASHLNPAVNTCWPLIARAKGQKEKNRCIPELSNNFRWGWDQRLVRVQWSFWTLTKETWQTFLVSKWDTESVWNPTTVALQSGTTSERHQGALKIGATSLLPHQGSKNEIRHTTTMSAWSDPVMGVAGTTGLPPCCARVYLLGSPASRLKIRTCSWSQTWRSGTGDMGQRWHGMFTWQGGKDLVIYTTMHHLLQQMGHSALTESC